MTENAGEPGGAVPWWQRRPWLAALLLYLPMAAIYLQPFLLHSPFGWPSGFLQYDQASYMAVAREYVDQGFGFTAGNPFSPDPQTPRLFFQPWTFALGLVWHATGIDPGRLYLLFGLASGIVMVRLAIALYLRLPAEARQPCGGLGLLLFVWGGGLFFLAGLGHSLSTGVLTSASPFVFDPADGLWFLNLGRNLFYSCEAFYHALALGLLVALVDRRWVLAALLALLLMASHPFTGTQLLLVALGWCVVERLLDRRPPPLALGAALLLLLALGFLYYLWFLPAHSPEHADLERLWRYAASDPLRPLSALLGWGPVALLALVALARCLVPFDRLQRLLWVMASGSFLLANHELFIEPHQPLHFTRGYVWTPLFLLGLPALQRLLAWLGQRHRAAMAALAALFLLDNAAWVSIQFLTNVKGAGHQLELPPDSVAAMQRLKDPALKDHLLVTDDRTFAILAVVETPLRAWASHIASTPYATERLTEVAAWHAQGTEPPDWARRPVVFVRELPPQGLGGLAWAADAQSVERYGNLVVVIRGARTP